MSDIIYEKILLETEDIINSCLSLERNNYKNNIDFLNDFTVLYNQKKQQLPYEINLIELLHINENAHSRILAKLLQHNRDKDFKFLKIFVKYIEKQLHYTEIKIEEPVITVEKHRIDCLIKDKNYAIIIENKVHNAQDRIADEENEIKGQLCKYIDICIEEYGIPVDKIFVVYLTDIDRDKKPHSGSWIKYNNGKKYSYKNDFKNRFVILSYKYDILLWLKEYDLIEFSSEETLLKSALIQYIDYLENKFECNQKYYKMNKELRELLIEKLNFSDNTIENIEKVDEKLKEIDKLRSRFEEIRNEQRKEFWKQTYASLKNDFSDGKYKIINNIELDSHPHIGLEMSLNNKKFLVLLEAEGSIIYPGIRVFNWEDNKEQEIQNFVNDIVSNLNGFKTDNKEWYCWKSIPLQEGYYSLKALIGLVESNL